MTDSFPAFDLQLRTRVIRGPGTIGRLGECAESLKARRALLVTDPGIVAAGHVARALDSLESAGIAVTSFTEVRENPTTLDVDACLAVAQDFEPDLLVGETGDENDVWFGSLADVASLRALSDGARGFGVPRVCARGGAIPEKQWTRTTISMTSPERSCNECSLSGVGGALSTTTRSSPLEVPLRIHP